MKQYIPLALATAAAIAALIACTVWVERHLDTLAPPNNAFELAAIQNRLQEIEQYACSMDRTLQSIDTNLLPPAVRGHVDFHVQSCPGDPGQPEK